MNDDELRSAQSALRQKITKSRVPAPESRIRAPFVAGAGAAALAKRGLDANPPARPVREVLSDAPVNGDDLEDVLASPEDLAAYALRETWSLFECACLLHGAAPEQVARRAYDDRRKYELQAFGPSAASLRPADIDAWVDLQPEAALGDTIGGTLKRLRIASGAKSMHHSVTQASARSLARGLGLAVPDSEQLAHSPVATTERLPGKTLRLPTGTTHVRFDELASLIADALWPSLGSQDSRLHYGGARTNLEDELRRAVEGKQLRVLDPLTLGDHTYPRGRALQASMVDVDDLRSWLQSSRRMVVEVVAPAQSQPSPKPLQRQKAQQLAILQKLRELGYEPEALPKARSGKSSAAKQAVKAALGYTQDVMNKAWQKLRSDGQIKDESR